MDVSSEIMGIAQQHLKRVKKSGPNNVMAICPFHLRLDGTEERHPSFAMNTSNGLYFCHSCGEKGNLFTFLKNMGVSRMDIDMRYGMVLEAAKHSLPPQLDPLDPKVVTLNPLPEALLGLFDYCPKELVDAGFLPETLRHFDVGFDMQHYRITFPLRDLHGQLLGISGRSVIGAWPRYKVYTKEYPCWGIPERPEIDKRVILYNSHLVYPACFFSSTQSEVIIVEGFKGCMWVYQAGFKNTTALLGTYMSQEHKWMLERMGATVYLFFDNNGPGFNGMLKTAENLRRSLDVRVMMYPPRLADDENAQPDNLTVDEVLESKHNALDYYKFLQNLA